LFKGGEAAWKIVSLGRVEFRAYRSEQAMLSGREPRFIVRNDLRGLGDYGTVGLDLVLSILLGFFGGRWLDGKLGTHGWLTALGFLFGVIAGFRSLYRAAVKWRKETEAEDERERRERHEDGPGSG
jgi:F0F1-type ATP synthase assembly protein I